jgi:pimeloyl-ACP methyl ester carboxylesterase
MHATRELSARPSSNESRRTTAPAAASAAAIAAAAGALGGWWLPRGPVTTSQALVAVLAGLAVGYAAGRLTGSRWALLLAPAVFALVFELARVRVDGPTIDAIRLDGIYGVLVLMVGRGVDGVLMVLPMLVGTGFGLVAFRRAAGTNPPGRWPGRIVLTVGTVLIAILVAGLLRPASTEPIAVDGSVAELVEVRVGGHEQSIMIRGESAQAPVLLYLEGGPGGTGIGRIRNSGTALEQHFVVAVWDQRGTGKSYDQLEPTDTLTVEQMVDDTLAVTDYLRERFDQEKIYLVGSSWGTTLGVLAAQSAPQKYHAYVGTGQMVDQFETDSLMYAQSLSDAQARGDDAAVQRLQEIGAPPYADTLSYTEALASNPRWVSFEHGDDYNAASEYPASLVVPEYSLIEQLRGMAAIAETFHVLYPQLAETDFRTQVPRLEVPVFIVQGEHEASGRSTLAREWFQQLSAPTKQYVVFDRSGHTPPYDEPGRFADYLRTVADQVEAA